MKKRVFFLVSVSLSFLLLGCPNSRQAVDAEISRAIQELSIQISYYAQTCYRPDASYEEGATLEEKNAYAVELIKEVMPLSHTDYSSTDLARLRDQWEEKKRIYSNEVILACAKRNFESIRQRDRAWFQIFDQYGIESEDLATGIAPLEQDLLESQIVLVGNDHTIANLPGKILFHISDFLIKKEKPPFGLFIEQAAKEFDLESFSGAREMGREMPNLSDEVREKKLHLFLEFQNKTFSQRDRFMQTEPAIVTLMFAMKYPGLSVVPVDFRDPNDSALLPRGVNLEIVKAQMEVLPPQEKWLMFYGMAHVMRWEGEETDASAIEQQISYRSSPAKTFIVGAHIGGNTLLSMQRAIDRNLFDEAMALALSYYGFGNKASEEKDVTKFLASLSITLEKYNALIKKHAYPIYVDLIHANSSRRPMDLLIIPSSSESNPEYVFNYLKVSLEEKRPLR